MNAKIRVSLAIQVSSLDKDVDIKTIRQELNNYVQPLSQRINLQDLGEWRLLILVVYRPTSGIGVFKRAKRYPSDKEFEISMSVSIPNEEQAPYGLAKARNSYYIPLNDKNFCILNPHFENYHNLYQYILESSKRVIDLAFTHGVTCNGKKIKFQK